MCTSRLLTLGRWALVVGSLFVGATGCAKAKAATVPDGPPLAMPAPPERELGPVEEVAAVPIGTPTADLPIASPGGRTTTTTSRQPARQPDVKPEPVVAQPVPPAAPPAPAATEAPRELRSVPSAVAAAEERKVKEDLSRAAAGLKGVDYGKLSAERQSQYNQAKRFAEQAEEELKNRNLPFAATLADKARQLADELAGLR